MDEAHLYTQPNSYFQKQVYEDKSKQLQEDLLESQAQYSKCYNDVGIYEIF